MNNRWHCLGPAVIIVGLLFRQPLLVIIGLLLTLVIAATHIWATYCLHDLRYQRLFSEQRVLFGEQITLSVSIENAKLLPLPWLEIEDTLPRALMLAGQRLRVSIVGDTATLDNLFSTRWYERVTRRYTLQCNARGVHKFGPTTLRSGDVFGFLSNEETLSNWQYLLVYPLVVPLNDFGLPARHPFGDRRAPRRLLEDPSRVIGVRDYTYGDSLRRVHWKATARAMQMQSKVYDATTTYTLVLFLNNTLQFDTIYGLQPDLQELAICAAASVSSWALDAGYAVGLYANSLMYLPEEQVFLTTDERADESGEARSDVRAEVGSFPAEKQLQQEKMLPVDYSSQLKRRRIHLPPASSEEQRQRILEVLARIQPYFGSTLEDIIQTERSHLPAGATIVVITSTISDLLLDTLARLKQSGHAVTLLFIGDSPLPARMAGISIYHLGGEDAWKNLVAAHGAASDESSRASSVSAGFRL